MQSKFDIEALENRRFLSGSPSVSSYIGETTGLVALATPAPSISITQRTMYFNAVVGTSNTQVLRITNQGTANLTLSPGSIRLAGAARKNFSVNFPEEGVSIKPGRRFDLAITFAAPPETEGQLHIARLVILTNDPNRRSVTVGLRALSTAGIGGSLEPSLQRVIDTFGLPINVGDATPDEYQLGTPTSGNDEVRIQNFVKAGPGAVSIRPLAVFGTDNGPAVRLGTYTPGIPDSTRQLWYVPREDAQSVNPKVYGQTLIDPGDNPFAIFAEFPGFVNPAGGARNVYQEDPLNSVWEPNNNQLRKMRVYPFKDQFGNAAPNTYLVAVEEYTSEYDYQDLLFIITNVRPLSQAASVPVLGVSNLTAMPNNDRMVFNKVEIPDENYPNITRLTNTVRISNNGSADLVVTVRTTGNFVIDRGGGTNVTIAPGAYRDVVIRFAATSGSLHSGEFQVTSNDPDHPFYSISLKGYWQQWSEFRPSDRKSVEPTARLIVNDLFGYTTKLFSDGQGLSTNGRVQTRGDEILSPYWKQADDGPVKVTLLAAFHGQTYVDSKGNIVPAQSFVNWYVKGDTNKKNSKQILKHGKGDGQSVMPRSDNTKLKPYASGQFNPQGKTFGFLVENNEWSDPTLNPDPQGRTGYGHFVRFWPAKDSQGKIIPNTYLMLHDYNRSFTNYDYQDNIFLVQNVVPVDAVKSPLTVFTEETRRGARISFTSPATGPRINGFRVYRSATVDGPRSLLTEPMLARRPVTTFIDTSVMSSETWYYHIVSVGANGTESQAVTVLI